MPLFDVSAFHHGDPLAGLVDGGTVFVPTPLTDPEEIWASLPAASRSEILRRNIRLLALDAAALAKYAPRPDLEIRMQGIALVGVFLRVSPFAERAGLDRAALREAVRANLTRFFGKRGKSVVDANLAVIDEAYDNVIDVTATVAGIASATHRWDVRGARMIDGPRRVADVMTGSVVSIAETASLAEAARLLDERRIAGMPVVDAGVRWSAS